MRTNDQGRSVRLITGLNQARRFLLRSQEEASVLRHVCMSLVASSPRRVAWLALFDEGKLVLAAHASGSAGIEAEGLARLDLSRPGGVGETAAQTGQTCVVETFTPGGLAAPWAAEAVRLGFEQAVAIPVSVRGEALGALVMFSTPEESLSQDEIELTRELADDLGYRVAEIRRQIKRDAEASRRESASARPPREVPVAAPAPPASPAPDERVNELTGQLQELNRQLSQELGERKRAEEALRQRLGVETAISTISARFVNPADFEKAVEASLSEIGALTGASRVSFYVFEGEPGYLTKRHEWCAEDVRPQIANLASVPASAVPWLVSRLGGGELLQITDVADMPDEAVSDREFLQSQDICSVLAQPVLEEKRLVAVVSIEDVVSSGSWREEDVALLRMVASIVGNTMLRHRTDEALNNANRELQRWVGELESHNKQIRELTEMSGTLQICQRVEETPPIVAQTARRLFREESGALYLFTTSRNLLEAAAVWGSPPPTERVFGPEACWALRRGRTHLVRNTRTGLICQHLGQHPPGSTLCVPLMAQGESLGVLFLQSPQGMEGSPAQLSEATQRMAGMVAEHLALTLSNIKLRETLQGQSIRDPLTSLYNRRYMESSLDRDLRRAARGQDSVGLMLIDLDHFKRFNDSHGHDAGDQLLRELGAALLQQFRGEDIACRYGGEEFTVILPSASPEDTRRRAEQLREAVSAIRVEHEGLLLDPVTASIGVAVFPHHGSTAETLLSAADAALYRAKAAGRNCVVVAPETP
ncbi:MAG: diguanylate cyclase [Acidobacteriota bacterium]